MTLRKIKMLFYNTFWIQEKDWRKETELVIKMEMQFDWIFVRYSFYNKDSVGSDKSIMYLLLRSLML